MPFPHFAFISDNLPRAKAKQLSKTFPNIKLSAAQEATAQALGYASWYECLHRNKSAAPSPSDQVAGLSTRVVRYNHQSNVLVRLGIPPSEADRWVRAWGLTGEPTFSPNYAVSTYYGWDNVLGCLERGEVSEDWLEHEYGADAWSSKYPDVDRPERVCSGVILGPMGKYPHWAVDHRVNAQIPAYLRSPSGLYHLEDDGDILAECYPQFNASPMPRKPFRELNLVQHEWHFEIPRPHSNRSVVQSLISAALKRPGEMMVISIRAMPLNDGKYDWQRHAVACLKGSDFADYLRKKGEFNLADVVWFDNVEFQAGSSPIDFRDILMGRSLFDEYKDAVPVFEGAAKQATCLPVYSYPFKQGPMHDDEYAPTIECFEFLPLSQDYPEDEDDDDDDGSDGDEPLIPSSPSRCYDFELA